MTPLPGKSPILQLAYRRGEGAAALRRELAAGSPQFDESTREQVADLAVRDAVALAGLVRDEDPMVVFGALARYSHEQLSVLTVALAALVPIDRPTSELTAWMSWASAARAG